MSGNIEGAQNQKSLALSMSGGGARAAYQVGLLRCIANHFPETRFPIITGVSAGAINAAHMANYRGSLEDSVDALMKSWCSLTPDQVFKLDNYSILKNLFRWGYRLIAGSRSSRSKAKGLVDTSPLREYLYRKLNTGDGSLKGIEKNLDDGYLQALAISTTNYQTGQTITWTQGCELTDWDRQKQRSRKTKITVEHIMASAALPLFFPAVKLEDGWHGDGGIRLYAPLSPAVNLGADKILAISTRYSQSEKEDYSKMVTGYPPPAQIVGVLMNAVFLDLLDQDANRLKRMNRMLDKIPREQWGNRRKIDLFVLRPSVDLGKLAGHFEPNLPPLFRYFLRGQGVKETASPDWLSMVLFDRDYITELVRQGEKDGEAHIGDLTEFFRQKNIAAS